MNRPTPLCNLCYCVLLVKIGEDKKLTLRNGASLDLTASVDANSFGVDPFAEVHLCGSCLLLIDNRPKDKYTEI